MEIWKDIPGYEGFYQVSDLGNVRSYDMVVNNCGSTKSIRKGKMLSKTKIKGYERVHLCKDGKTRQYYAHRLVLSTFLPNPDPERLTEVNHKNEDKSDNRLCNLEWCDRKYNNNYGTHTKRMIETKIKNGFWDPDLVGLGKKEYMKRYIKKVTK